MCRVGVLVGRRSWLMKKDEGAGEREGERRSVGVVEERRSTHRGKESGETVKVRRKECPVMRWSRKGNKRVDEREKEEERRKKEMEGGEKAEEDDMGS